MSVIALEKAIGTLGIGSCLTPLMLIVAQTMGLYTLNIFLQRSVVFCIDCMRRKLESICHVYTQWFPNHELQSQTFVLPHPTRYSKLRGALEQAF